MPQPTEVLEAIERWRSLDLRAAAFDQVVASMNEMRDEIQFSISQVHSGTPNKLWRVRRRDHAESFNCSADFWEPPPERARLSRCNNAREPALYCSKDLATALDESGIQNGDEMLLVRYRATRSLRLNRVVGAFDPRTQDGNSLLDESGLLAYRILREFLRAEFTKPVGTGTESLYKVSAAICRAWTGSGSDGWIYPSVRSPMDGNDNVALHPNSAREKLTIDAAHWCVAEDVKAVQRLGNTRVALPGIRLQHLFIADVGQDSVAWRQPSSADKVPAFAIRK